MTARITHGTKSPLRSMRKKPTAISSVTGKRIPALVRTVMPFFFTKESRCFLYICVLMNQSCSRCDELAKQNTVTRKNGTVGKIGSTMPTQPSARLRQPIIRKTSCLSFNFYLLGISSCGRFRPNRPCQRCASSRRGATRARPSCPRAPHEEHAG